MANGKWQMVKSIKRADVIALPFPFTICHLPFAIAIAMTSVYPAMAVYPSSFLMYPSCPT